MSWRTRETVVLTRTDDKPNVTHENVVSVGVWSLSPCADKEDWCIVHRPTGRTLWYLRCIRFGLALLDTLGAALPAYEALLSLGDEPAPQTPEAKLTREIVFGMPSHWDDIEDAYWPECMR